MNADLDSLGFYLCYAYEKHISNLKSSLLC